MFEAEVLIVEDDFSYALTLEMMLDEIGYRNITKVQSGEQALKNIQENPPDLILMDIQLEGEMTGIDVAKIIQDKNIPIIFLTAFLDEEHFESAKGVFPLAYLTKPFDKIVLERTLKLALAKIENERETLPDKYLFIRFGRKKVKVDKTDILWIKAEGNYCYLHTAGRKYVLKISLVRLKKQFPENLFLRCHRNVIVQINRVVKIDTIANKLYINDVELPIGSSFRKEVLDRFKNNK